MSEYTKSISSIHSTSVSKRTDIRMTTLEMMRKNYKDDADIINELTTMQRKRFWTLIELGMGSMSL